MFRDWYGKSGSTSPVERSGTKSGRREVKTPILGPVLRTKDSSPGLRPVSPTRSSVERPEQENEFPSRTQDYKDTLHPPLWLSLDKLTISCYTYDKCREEVGIFQWEEEIEGSVIGPVKCIKGDGVCGRRTGGVGTQISGLSSTLWLMGTPGWLPGQAGNPGLQDPHPPTTYPRGLDPDDRVNNDVPPFSSFCTSTPGIRDTGEPVPVEVTEVRRHLLLVKLFHCLSLTQHSLHRFQFTSRSFFQVRRPPFCCTI